jgi:hypothetical protein
MYSAGQTLGDSAVSGFSSKNSSASNAGLNLGLNFASGLKSARSSVSSAAYGLAAIVNSYLPHSPAEKGPLSVLPNFDGILLDPLQKTFAKAKSIVPKVVSTFSNLSGTLSNMSVSQNIGIQTPSPNILSSSINNTSFTIDSSLNVSIDKLNTSVQKLSTSIDKISGAKSNTGDFAGMKEVNTNYKINTINNNGSTLSTNSLRNITYGGI